MSASSSSSSSSSFSTILELNSERLAEDEFESMGVVDKDGQFRDWFFTINSPPLGLQCGSFWSQATKIFGDIRGGVMQVEKSSRTHLQGCFKTIQKVRPITMKNKVRSKNLLGWIKPCVSLEKSIAYCTKTDTRQAGPFWFGEWTEENQGKRDSSTQGKRTDLALVADDVDSGKSISEVAKAHPTAFIKYHGGIAQYMSVTKSVKPRDFMTKLVIFWGASGTGKSRRAWHEANLAGSVYELPVAKEANVIWWPGYTGQDSVILDDFYGWFPFHSFLKMIDRYEWKVRTVGDTFVQFTSRTVYVTSNSNWPTWYSSQLMKEGHWRQAFERRIFTCTEFKEGDFWEPPTEIMASSSSSSSSSSSCPLASLRAERDQRYVDEVCSDIDRDASPLTRNIVMEEHHARYCVNHECDCATQYEAIFNILT